MKLSGTQIRDAIHRGDIQKVLRHVREIEDELQDMRRQNLAAAVQLDALETRLKYAQSACETLTNDWQAALEEVERLKAERGSDRLSASPPTQEKRR